MKDADITLYEHLTSIYEQSGEQPDELDGPEMPEVIIHIWEWFTELNKARAEGPISYTEIKAWSELTGQQINAFEISLIKQIDIEYLNQQRDAR